MARLRRPELPVGPHSEFNTALHELHHRAGWPSVRVMMDEVGIGEAGRSRIYDAFSSVRLPTWGLVELIAESLAKRVPGRSADAEPTLLHELWLAASGAPVPEIRRPAESEWFEEELASIRAVVDAHARALLLAELASRMTEDDERRSLQAEALRSVRTIRNNRSCARALVELSSGLDADQRGQALTDALNFVRSIGKEEERVETLAEVACHLDGEHLRQALGIARALRHPAPALIGLAKNLKDREGTSHRALRADAMAIADEVNDDVARCRVYEAIVPYLDGDEPDVVLEAVRHIENPFSAAGLLARLARQGLTDEQRDRALAAAYALDSRKARSEAFVGLGPYLGPDQLATVIADVDRMVGDEVFESRLQTLQGLARQLP
ncbi:hypothetical protein [Streptomyces sp. NPDC051109]|uniref:hypothetical protein n=1 Tax=Streptomyces sp. NPDC051109 TaxID=3365642 RepID=UPI001066A3BA